MGTDVEDVLEVPGDPAPVIPRKRIGCLAGAALFLFLLWELIFGSGSEYSKSPNGIYIAQLQQPITLGLGGQNRIYLNRSGDGRLLFNEDSENLGGGYEAGFLEWRQDSQAFVYLHRMESHYEVVFFKLESARWIEGRSGSSEWPKETKWAHELVTKNLTATNKDREKFARNTLAEVDWNPKPSAPFGDATKPEVLDEKTNKLRRLWAEGRDAKHTKNVAAARKFWTEGLKLDPGNKGFKESIAQLDQLEKAR